ncbi:hypothetical protein MNBD_GAMMA25-2224 [hydrothermal vent metagenome]|uniref:STAS/SEC14 domain-containing protein n=1 Tax=hydrothermal vent metagenome TaxID=652676 RepID=A0A3B1BY89_9ZZZZ
MALTYKIFNDGLTVIATASGCVTGEEFTDYAFWLIKNHGALLKPNLQHMIICRQLEDIQVTEQDIHRLAHINLTYGAGRGKIHTAIVSQNSEVKKLASLHKTLSQLANIEVALFENHTKALDWLDVNEDKPCAYAAKMATG